ncbi:carbamoyltransferase HypF [Desulfomarina sp.]
MSNSNTKHKHKQQGVEILVRGTVQGVGFRPFVYNLATRLSLRGTVSNTERGVSINVVGEDTDIKEFLYTLSHTPPPLSSITDISKKPFFPDPAPDTFTIKTSLSSGEASTSIPPDVALCRDCLAELHNPGDRRHNYPFINCTNCGPRFSIIEAIPYDRPKTSMKSFPMCTLCKNEYHDPTDRRFHAQPNACHSCGPAISWHDREGNHIATDDIFRTAAGALAADRIVALRGLGGFHLVANGYSVKAVNILRQRKKRPDKPLAVMVADTRILTDFCYCSEDEKKLLLSPTHPVVLLKKKKNGLLAENLAPGIGEIGVMLPYTPLHHLLFGAESCPPLLVMTSGNMSGTPICTANREALDRLSSIADFFLLHNRDIITRVDDSVTKIIAGKQMIFRRARGYVPEPLHIPWHLPKILGCGGGLKSTFCLGRDRSCYLSQHIGDLNNLESLEFFLESIDHFKRLFQLEPEAIACDLHPDYMSSLYAEKLNLPLYRIQHHHAHAVAVMGEHGLSGPVLAIVMDGTGYGPDGTIWGGEILQADLTSYKRLGHLGRLHLPGGDKAATEPWRMGLSALFNSYGEKGLAEENLPLTLKHISRTDIDTLRTMMCKNINSPLTSSCGRLFDAIASILGVTQHISYEGQAAMELETLAKKLLTSPIKSLFTPNTHNFISSFIHEKEGKWEISSKEFVKMVMAGLAEGKSRAELALQFHLELVEALAGLTRILSSRTGIRQVVLAGGCMQNSLLYEGLYSALHSLGLETYTGEKLPVNDGAISFGQIITGGLQHVSCHTHEGHQG